MGLLFPKDVKKVVVTFYFKNHSSLYAFLSFVNIKKKTNDRLYEKMKSANPRPAKSVNKLPHVAKHIGHEIILTNRESGLSVNRKAG